MSSLSYWAVWLFVIVEVIFEYFAMGESTNWSIFYFSSVYLSISMVCADLFFYETAKAVRATSIAFCLFFVVLIVLELKHINMPFLEYMVSVNDDKTRVMAFAVIIIATLGILISTWEKIRLQK